jgi:hypothetical protein
MDAQEAHMIENLKKISNDPEHAEYMQAGEALAKYYHNRHLGCLLAIAHDDQYIELLWNTFHNAQKVRYCFEKCITKIKRFGVPEKFILEIANFEKRFLDEKYHAQSNMILLQFVTMVAYHNDSDQNNAEHRQEIIGYALGLDKFIRKQWDEETREKILNNILIFEEAMLNHEANIPSEEDNEIGNVVDKLSKSVQ